MKESLSSRKNPFGVACTAVTTLGNMSPTEAVDIPKAHQLIEENPFGGMHTEEKVMF